jgi:hypothetical protein
MNQEGQRGYSSAEPLYPPGSAAKSKSIPSWFKPVFATSALHCTNGSFTMETFFCLYSSGEKVNRLGAQFVAEHE